jgi:hypothetical protein
MYIKHEDNGNKALQVQPSNLHQSCWANVR